MKTTNVAIVNGISLQVVADEREQLVAVKPVCEILGVYYPKQLERLKRHPVFSQALTKHKATAKDGKEHIMTCISLRFLAGWLCSIDPCEVKEDKRENFMDFLKLCGVAIMGAATALPRQAVER